MLVKEGNSLSVALKSSKKDVETLARHFEIEKEALKADLVNLQSYKTQHLEIRCLPLTQLGKECQAS